MPYFAHPQRYTADHIASMTLDTIQDDAEFRQFATKDEATTARADGERISFKADASERYRWQYRERERRQTGEYVSPPWKDADWREPYHYEHISLKHSGKVAYTPDDTYGHEDRQLVVSVGKYLKMVCPDISQAEIDDYAGEMRAITDASFKLATSAEDIERVYTNGPSSCMAHKRSYFACDGHHPTEVYANCDLAIAYLDDASGKVNARCIVWPERKLYNRCYGSVALITMLKADGYTNGDLIGARIRRIRFDDVYVMPYLDCADGVESIAGERNFWRLTSHCSDNATSNTNGLSGDIERYTCSDCECSMDEDRTRCESCDKNYWSCDMCEGEFHSDHDSSCELERANRYATNGGVYTVYVCQSCYDDNTASCERCDDTYSTCAFTRAQSAERADNGTDDMCPDCAEGVHTCEEHDTHYHEDDDDDCPDCIAEREEREAERERVRELARERRGYTCARFTCDTLPTDRVDAIRHHQTLLLSRLARVERSA